MNSSFSTIQNQINQLEGILNLQDQKTNEFFYEKIFLVCMKEKTGEEEKENRKKGSLHKQKI
jgi:inosine/xanthosine triphosphate pyrophosphatase family protein